MSVNSPVPNRCGAAFIVRCFALAIALVGFSRVASAGPPWYDTWVAGGALDQKSAMTTFHSGLVGYNNADVLDTDLLADALLLCQKTQVIWVFGTCFGGGMFDELNTVPVGNNLTQAGHSGSGFNEPIYYYNPTQMNTDWVLQYLVSLGGNNTASKTADDASANDPFGPNPAMGIRNGEVAGSEHPLFFASPPMMGANNLKFDKGGVAILFAGKPAKLPGANGEKLDQRRVLQAITTLTNLGMKTDKIFVLYDKGKLAANHPIVTAMGADAGLNIRAGTKLQLDNLIRYLYVPSMDNVNKPARPASLFLLAVDHGLNTDPAANCGGGGGIVDDTDPAGEGDQGQGDPATPPALPTPPDDDCPTPAPMPSDGSYGFNTMCAGQDGPGACGGAGGPDRWFRYTPTSPRTAFVQIDGADFDAFVAVYPALTCPPGAPLGCSVGAPNGRVVFNATSGQSYLIQVGGLNGAHGFGRLVLGSTPTGVGRTESEVALSLVRPNPTHDGARLSFVLGRAAAVSVVVYDVAGRPVRDLEHGWREAGEHSLAWDGRDDLGRVAPTGIYLVRLVAGGVSRTSSLTITR